MLSRDEMLNLLELALRHSPAEQTEVVLTATTHGLTRLANNGIHQNVAMTDATARVRAVVGQRVGVATGNTLDGAGLRELAERATAIARVSEPNPDFIALPPPTPPDAPPNPVRQGPDTVERGMHLTAGTPSDETFATAFSPERRAAMAATLVETATGNGVTASGHVSTGHTALAVGNSLGTQTFHQWTECGVMAIMTREDASGYAVWDGAHPDGAPVGAVAAAAAAKCLAGAHPIAVEPGPYTVILEPPAVAEMLAMLAFIGLGAAALLEGRSFMSGKVGQTVAGDNITLRDDTYHAGMIPLPFDYEGVPRQVVPLIEQGVARGVVYDSLTAHQTGAGQHTTGHALPAPNPEGPFPLHLVLSPGRHSREQMIAGVERGILITRFHYVNIVHPMETILTGMTRDGTFLIEGGAVTRPLKNLRFTQSIMAALSHVTALEHTQTLINQEGLYCLAPALRVEGFTFTS